MTSHASISAARAILRAAVAAGTFPAATVEIGDSKGPIWREPFGSLTFDDGAPATTNDTVFDLASITKVVATTTLLLAQRAERRLALEETLASIFPEWRGDDRAGVTVRDLLEHSSGLPARLVDAPPTTRREFEHDICALPLEYAPGSRALYSDLDFILLGFLVVDRGSAPLDRLFAEFSSAWTSTEGSAEPGSLGFAVPPSRRLNTAPTDPLPLDPRRGRRLVGEVHDDYAAALGSVAGHAGLFADSGGVAHFARLMLRGARGDRSLRAPFSPDVVDVATTPSGVPGSSRALGWDTMRATSSCGTMMSTRAFGHVGFTGTSLWIDPARDRYFILLSNRVCGGGTSDDMQIVRRAFHDALGDV